MIPIAQRSLHAWKSHNKMYLWEALIWDCASPGVILQSKFPCSKPYINVMFYFTVLRVEIIVEIHSVFSWELGDSPSYKAKTCSGCISTPSPSIPIILVYTDCPYLCLLCNVIYMCRKLRIKFICGRPWFVIVQALGPFSGGNL